MKQLVLSALVSAVVSCGASWIMRPVPDAAQQARIERIEGRLKRIAAVVGLVFGEGE